MLLVQKAALQFLLAGRCRRGLGSDSFEVLIQDECFANGALDMAEPVASATPLNYEASVMLTRLMVLCAAAVCRTRA